MRKYFLYILNLLLLSSSVYGMQREGDQQVIEFSAERVKPAVNKESSSVSFEITQRLPKDVQEVIATFHDPVTLQGMFMRVAEKVIAIDRQQEKLAPVLKSPLKLKFTGNKKSANPSNDFQNALVYIIQNGSEEMRRRIVGINASYQGLSTVPSELSSFTALSNRQFTTFLHLRMLNFFIINLPEIYLKGYVDYKS